MLLRPSSLQGIGWGALLLPILFFSNASASEVACAWDEYKQFQGCWDDGKEKSVSIPDGQYGGHWMMHTHPIDKSFSIKDLEYMLANELDTMVVLSPNNVYYFTYGNLAHWARKSLVRQARRMKMSGYTRSQWFQQLADTTPGGKYKVYKNPGLPLTKDGLKQLFQEFQDDPPD